MEDTKYILLVMNCIRYQNKAELQKDIWLSRLDSIPYYHVLGNPKLDKEYVFDEKNKKLYVKTNDDYNSLPNKVIAAYQAALDYYPQLQYILKTDDDQVLQYKHPDTFFDKIVDMLEKNTHEQQIHYAGHIVNITTPYKSEYYRIHDELPKNMILDVTKYCSGRFYILSKDAISSLLKKRHYIEKEYLEDYAIGRHLDDRFKVNIKQLASNVFFKDLE